MSSVEAPTIITHKMDTETEVYFYEQDFYVLSNFSAFSIWWKGHKFDTLEHAYHWEKFHHEPGIQSQIKNASSAHEAFQIAQRMKAYRRSDWEVVQVPIMKDLMKTKAAQHEYVYRKLMATGKRILIEDSWRDGFWGEGPDKNGKNMAGKLWMEIRDELSGKEKK